MLPLPALGPEGAEDAQIVSLLAAVSLALLLSLPPLPPVADELFLLSKDLPKIEAGGWIDLSKGLWEAGVPLG